MPENEETTPEQKPTEPTEDEIAAMQADAQTLREMNEVAKQAGFKDATELFREGGRALYEKMKGEQNKPKVPVETKSPEPQKPVPTEDTETKAFARQALLMSMKSDYLAEQRALPADKQDGIAIEDLWKVIQSDSGPMAAHLANTKFNHNIFAAAAYMKKMETGAEKYREEGRLAAEAEAKAKLTASTTTGGRLPSEEQSKQEEEFRRRIAPVTYKPPTG